VKSPAAWGLPVVEGHAGVAHAPQQGLLLPRPGHGAWVTGQPPRNSATKQRRARRGSRFRAKSLSAPVSGMSITSLSANDTVLGVPFGSLGPGPKVSRGSKMRGPVLGRSERCAPSCAARRARPAGSDRPLVVEPPRFLRVSPGSSIGLDRQQPIRRQAWGPRPREILRWAKNGSMCICLPMPLVPP